MDYTTVFDVSEVGYRQWSFAAFGLIFVIVGLAIPFFLKTGLMRKTPPGRLRWFRPVFIVFASLWTIVSFVMTYTDYRGALDALRSGHAKVVEGLVADYQLVPYKSESFTVQGVRFQYSDYDVSAGFDNMASNGGPIREGIPVKIWYWRNEIVRLQIKKEPNHALEPTPDRRGNLFSMTSSHYFVAALALLRRGSAYSR